MSKVQFVASSPFLKLQEIVKVDDEVDMDKGAFTLEANIAIFGDQI